MLKKTAIIVVTSQIALAGALYAGDASWFAGADTEMASAAPTSMMKTVRSAMTIDRAEAADEVATTQIGDPCASIAWPDIPLECLSAGDGVDLEARGTVRQIGFN